MQTIENTISLNFVLVFCLIISGADAFLGHSQNITIYGQVGCDKYAQRGVTVELREYDRFPDVDDVLASTITGRSGKFKLVGREKELMTIEPYLRIIHHCVNGAHKEECNATFEYPIPRKYIGQIYHMGIINLSIITQRHSIKCVEEGGKRYYI
ncbi:unnamed protein product [Anisakis simplex]|uniref:Transthyretin-like family protein n=1 Tax=Anisakis simplex TaxID=6269 RepID=A0A0M3K3U5_ANISI|nr:unnamed protein product [Anisakis simplex]